MTRKNAEKKRAANAARESKPKKDAAKPKGAKTRTSSKRSARAAADAGASDETQSNADETERFFEAIGAPASPAADASSDPAAETESAPRPEVDPTKLKPEDLRKRVAKVYQLEREVERARAVFDLSRRHFASAKRALADAEELLEQEIRDQRYGPGPLFSLDGQGAASVPSFVTAVSGGGHVSSGDSAAASAAGEAFLASRGIGVAP